MTEHLFRAAKKAGVQGAYVVQTSPPEQKTLPPRPAVYVAEARTRDEARKIHQRLWNLGNTPFIIILLPNEIRVYTGFDFSLTNEKQGLVKSIIDLTFESICDQLADFRADSIDSGRIWETQSKYVTPEKRVDTHLLKNLKELEDYLKDKGLDLPIIHALIGKYVYIRYLYDRKILSEEWLLENNLNLDSVLSRNSTLAGLLHLTEVLESRFNGAIFPLPSNIASILSDEIVSLVASTFKGDDPISGQLHLDFEAYDFSYIPVETLSSIYEQFLHSQGTDKKVGAVYTPEPVADYLLCELEQSKPLQSGMKILDPCCGSGVFLVLAYRRLIELALAQSPNNKLKPTELRRILCESLYGIERNKEACYVAEFSLILTLLNYIDPPELHRNKQFKFPSLHNAQIFECDFFDDASEFWKQNEKFDWIVGNPPWIELKPKTVGEEFAHSWMRRNVEERPTTGNRVCEAFSWRVADLLKIDGHIGLLMHANSLFNHESEKYRSLFFKQFKFFRITNFSNLAYVLFAGRGEAPAATFIYAKAEPGEYKHSIIHYAPFVANQISNRPWKADKKNSTWTIAINESEIQSVSHEEAESGKASIWKLAIWGTCRDAKALSRLRRLFPSSLDELILDKDWNLCQGPLLKNELDFSEAAKKTLTHIPNLEEYKLLDVDALAKERKRVSIPEQVLRIIPPEMCFIRTRSGKAGLRIIKAPHLIFNAAYCIYGDEDFVIPAPNTGLSANKQEDANYLRALSIFISSSIIQFFLFFESPSWGVERSRIYAKDIRKIPVPHFSPEQIRKLAQLQRELVSLEINAGCTSSYIQDRIDKAIVNELQIPQNLNTVARDFIQIRFQLNKGKAVVSATNLPPESDLLMYGLCLRNELDAFTEGSGLRHKVKLTYSRQLIVCSVEFTHPDVSTVIDVTVEEAQGDSSLFLRYIQEKAQQRFSQWVYVQRSLRIFQDSRVHICKSPRLIDWTRTQALNDADDIIAEILSANREIHEVDR